VTGEYYFDAAPAGRYLLAVNPNGCPVESGYSSIFYPGTTMSASAKVIIVEDGNNLTLENFDCRRRFEHAHLSAA